MDECANWDVGSRHGRRPRAWAVQSPLFTEPAESVRPLAQYAVRTHSKEQISEYYHAVVFTSRTELTMAQVMDYSDDRAGIEADLKGDKHGLGVAIIRKHRLPAQNLVILLMQLAH